MSVSGDGPKNRLHIILLSTLAVATALIVIPVNGKSLAANSTVARANYARLPEATPTTLTSPTTTTTPTCCMLTADIQTTCSINEGIYTINFNADILNSCGSTINVAANFYLEVSPDNVNFGFIRRTSIQNYVFQPGHNYTSDVFSNVDISPLDHYYRIRMQVYAYGACGIYELYSPSAPLCALPTQTVTPVPTITPTGTSTSTSTPAPSGIVIGHVTWQGSSQPDPRQVQAATLVICVSGSPQSYLVTTDDSGYFTVATGLPDGTYNWWIKSVRTLANAGSLTIAGGAANQEMGAMQAGDANNDNLNNAQDFNILKNSFGRVGTGLAADFDNNGVVNAQDFNLLKAYIGRMGSPPGC